jgi:hypothetical protein
VINPHGDAAAEYERINNESRRAIATVWLKPNRVETVWPGLRLTSIKTNGGDTLVCVTLDPDGMFGDD